jgi:predicted metal-binding membrane protein
MLLLFAGGLMNVIWITGLSVVVLMEKLAPAPVLIAKLTGAASIAVAIALVVAII